MLMTNGNLPMTDAQKKALLDFVRSGKGFVGAHCAAAHLLQLPGVRRDARRLLPPLDPAERDRRAEGRGPGASGDEDAGRQLAAGRRVLPLRHGAVGRGAAERQHRRAVRQSHPDGRSRATACTCCSASTPRRPTSRACPTSSRAATIRRRGRAATARAGRSTRRSDTATTSGRTTRSSAPTSTAGSAGRWGLEN